MRSPCCLCFRALPPINFWMPESIFIKGGTYITSPEPISAVYLINPSHRAVRLYVYPSIVARQRQVRKADKKYIRNNRRIVRRVVLHEIRVVPWKAGDKFPQNFLFLCFCFWPFRNVWLHKYAYYPRNVCLSAITRGLLKRFSKFWESGVPLNIVGEIKFLPN
jgi:hypothetical protein